MQSAVTSKGQATIPKPIRDHLGLKTGDRVKFFIQPDGHVVMLRTLPITALRGILPARKTVSLEEMDAAIAKEATRRFMRSKKK